MKNTIAYSLLLVLLFISPINDAFSQTGQSAVPLDITGLPIYAVKENGDLLWFSHQGFPNGSNTWAYHMTGKAVSGAWLPNRQIFKGNPGGVDKEEGIIYRVDINGDMFWYKHTGHRTGSAKWVRNDGKLVGRGFKGKHVFAGGGGIIYFIDDKGDLYWYKHLGYLNGAYSWANGAVGKKVADGTIVNPRLGGRVATKWRTARFVFSGGNGVIYLIDRAGDLYWYKHTGFLDGTERWQGPNRIARNWQDIRVVFSGGNGSIYAVHNRGILLWYKHIDFAGGTDAWENNREPRRLGGGWIYQFVF